MKPHFSEPPPETPEPFHQRPIPYVPGTSITLPFSEQNSVEFPEISDNTFEDIEGWFGPAQAQHFASFIDNCEEGATLVEIGAWLGRSTRWQAQYIKDSGKQINYHVIDTFKGSQNEDEHVKIVEDIGTDGSIRSLFNKNLEGLEDYISVIEGDSAESAGEFEDESVDMVYIDGDHSLDGVARDIIAFYPKLKMGAILSGDDYHPVWGVYSAVNNIVGALNLDIYAYVWRTTKKERDIWK